MNKLNALTISCFLTTAGAALADDLPVASENGPDAKVTITTTIHPTTNDVPVPRGIGITVDRTNGNSGSISIDQDLSGQPIIRGGYRTTF